MEKNKKYDLFALASIPLMMTLGNSMLIPVLPTIEKEIGITKFQSSLIITVYSIVSIFFIPAAGYLSDRFGRKKVIIPSLIVTGVGGIISGLAAWFLMAPYLIILLGRLVQGIGSSGAFPVVIPTVGDMFKNESDVSQGLGIIETSNTFGKVLSPILGSALALWAWFVPFLAIPVLSAVSILLVLFLVKTPKSSLSQQQKNFKSFISGVRDILKEKGRWLYSIFFLGWICMFVYFSFLFYFSSVLEDQYQVKGFTRGLVIAIPLLLLCITSFATGKVIGRQKARMKWITFSGFAAAAVVFPFLAFLRGLVLFTFVLSLASIGIGATLPCMDSLVTEGIDKKNRGTITSLYSSMRLLGVAVGPPAASVLMKWGSMATFFTLAAFTACAAFVTLIFIKPEKDEAASA